MSARDGGSPNSVPIGPPMSPGPTGGTPIWGTATIGGTPIGPESHATSAAGMAAGSLSGRAKPGKPVIGGITPP